MAAWDIVTPLVGQTVNRATFPTTTFRYPTASTSYNPPTTLYPSGGSTPAPYQPPVIVPSFQNMPQITKTAVAAATAVAKPATVQLSTIPLGVRTPVQLSAIPQGGLTPMQLSTVPQGGYTPVQLSTVPHGGLTPVQLSTVPQGGYTPVQLGNVVQPQTMQLGNVVQPQTVQLGSQVKPAVVQIGSVGQTVTLADGTKVTQAELIDQVNALLGEINTAATSINKIAAADLTQAMAKSITQLAATEQAKIAAAATPEFAWGNYQLATRNLRLADEEAQKALVGTPTQAITTIAGNTINTIDNVVTASRNLGLTPEMQTWLETSAGENAVLLGQFSTEAIESMKAAYSNIENHVDDGRRLLLNTVTEKYWGRPVEQLNLGTLDDLKATFKGITDGLYTKDELAANVGKYALTMFVNVDKVDMKTLAPWKSGETDQKLVHMIFNSEAEAKLYAEVFREATNGDHKIQIDAIERAVTNTEYGTTNVRARMIETQSGSVRHADQPGTTYLELTTALGGTRRLEVMPGEDAGGVVAAELAKGATSVAMAGDTFVARNGQIVNLSAEQRETEKLRALSTIDIAPKTTEPTVAQTLGDWLGLSQDNVTTLGDVVGAVKSFYERTDNKLIESGLGQWTARETLETGQVPAFSEEWGIGKLFTFGAEILKGRDANTAWANADKGSTVALNEDGNKLAIAAANDYENTGKLPSIPGMTNSDVLTMIARASWNPATATYMEKNTPSAIAALSYNPIVKMEAEQTFGEAKLALIAAANPLTSTQKNEIYAGTASQMVSGAFGADLTGNVLLDVALIPITVSSKVVSGPMKIMKAAAEVLSNAGDATKILNAVSGAGAIARAADAADIIAPLRLTELPTGSIATAASRSSGTSITGARAVSTSEPVAKITTDLVYKSQSLNPIQFSAVVTDAARATPTEAAHAIAEIQIAHPYAADAIEAALPNIAERTNVRAVVQEATQIANKVSVDTANRIAYAHLKGENAFVVARDTLEQFGITPTYKMMDIAATTPEAIAPMVARAMVDEVLATANAPAALTRNLAPSSSVGGLVATVSPPMRTMRISSVISTDLGEGLTTALTTSEAARLARAANIKEIKDLASLPPIATNAFIQRTAEAAQIDSKRLVAAVEWANKKLDQEYLGKDNLAEEAKSGFFDEASKGGVTYASDWEHAMKTFNEAKNEKLRILQATGTDGDEVWKTMSREELVERFREITKGRISQDVAKDIDTLLLTGRMSDGSLVNTTKQWANFVKRVGDDEIVDELEQIVSIRATKHAKHEPITILNRVARNNAAMSTYVKSLPSGLQSVAKEFLENGQGTLDGFRKIIESLPPKDAGHFIDTIKTTGYGTPISPVPWIFERASAMQHMNKTYRADLKAAGLNDVVGGIMSNGGRITLDELEAVKGVLKPDDYEHFVSMLKNVPPSDIEGGLFDTVTRAEAKLNAINEAKSYLANLPQQVREVAEKALRDGKLSEHDLNVIKNELGKAMPSEGAILSAVHFEDALKMEGDAFPKWASDVADQLRGGASRIIEKPPITEMEQLAPEKQVATLKSVPTKKKDLTTGQVYATGPGSVGMEKMVPPSLPVDMTKSGRYVHTKPVPDDAAGATKYADDLANEIAETDDYKMLSDADRAIVDKAMNPVKGKVNEAGQRALDIEQIDAFRDLQARLPEIGKAVQKVYDARIYGSSKFVSWGSVSDAFKAMSDNTSATPGMRNMFDEAAETLRKLDPKSGTLKGDHYFNDYKGATSGFDDLSAAQIRTLAEHGVDQKIIDRLLDAKAARARAKVAAGASADAKRGLGKVIMGDKPSMPEARAMWQSPLAKEIDDAIGASRLVETRELAKVYADAMLDALDEAILKGDDIAAAALRTEINDAKKVFEEIKKVCTEQGLLCGGAAGAIGGGSKLMSGAVGTGLGLAAVAAGIAGLNSAKGDTWAYNSDKQTFIKVEKTGQIGSDTAMPVQVQKAYNVLNRKGFFDQVEDAKWDPSLAVSKYQWTEGDIPGLQYSSKLDPREVICTQIANWAVDALRAEGIDAAVVSMASADGKLKHATIGIRIPGSYDLYTVDTLKYMDVNKTAAIMGIDNAKTTVSIQKETPNQYAADVMEHLRDPTNWAKSQEAIDNMMVSAETTKQVPRYALLEPTTGQRSAVGSDFTGQGYGWYGMDEYTINNATLIQEGENLVEWTSPEGDARRAVVAETIQLAGAPTEAEIRTSPLFYGVTKNSKGEALWGETI